MKRKIIVPLALLLPLALAQPAAAHELTVRHPRSGEMIRVQWIGGFTVPADAEPMFGPFNLPPSHLNGLPHACQRTATNPAVSIKAPPSFTGCQHGT